MTAAVIPTIGRSPYLLPLLQVLHGECMPIYLPDNMFEHGRHGVQHLLDTQEGDWSQVRRNISVGLIVPYRTPRTIYESWNYHLNRHRRIAVLNDDIVLVPGSVSEAVRHLRPHHPLVGLNYDTPNEPVRQAGTRSVRGTYRHHGLGGFAFVALSAHCGRVDERFRWWYGDDDLVRSTMIMGKSVQVAMGAPVAHPHPSLSSDQPWIPQAIEQDTRLFLSKYGTLD